MFIGINGDRTGDTESEHKATLSPRRRLRHLTPAVLWKEWALNSLMNLRASLNREVASVGYGTRAGTGEISKEGTTALVGDKSQGAGVLGARALRSWVIPADASNLSSTTGCDDLHQLSSTRSRTI